MSARPSFPHLPAESWALFLADELPEGSALKLEEHLDACADCRASLLQADPSRMFRALRGARAPEGTWDGFWDDVEAEISRPAETPARIPMRGRLAFLAGVAASLAIAALLLVQARRGTEGQVARTEPAPCPAEAESLHLTHEECAALFGKPIVAPGPPEIVIDSHLDLRGL